MRRPSRTTTTVGGGILGGLALVSGLTATALHQRYVTAQDKVAQLVEVDSGILVVLADGKVFEAPADQRTALEAYVGDTATPLPYRIDRFSRTKSGAPAGKIDAD